MVGLILWIALPATGFAQAGAPARGRETSVGFGASWNAPVEFNPQRCGSSVSATVGTGVIREVASRFWLGVRGDIVYGNPFKREKCFFETVTAPVPSGASDVVRVEATHRVPQYSYLDVAGVAAFDPIDTRWVRVRLYGGVAGVAFKPVLPLFYGLEVLPRVGPMRLALSVEQWRWNVRLDSVQYHFLDGTLRSRTATGFSDSRRPVYFRISTVSGFGGRGPR